MPTILAYQTCMGTSTGYQSLVSLPFVLFDKKSLLEKSNKFEYVLTFVPTTVALQWQIFYSTAACLGALTSSYTSAPTFLPSSSSSFHTTLGLSAGVSFIGGFLMLFGSRLAAGCTSAHGISGFPMLLVHSWIAVPAMFAGGIVSAFIMQAVLGHDDFMRKLESTNFQV